MLDTLKSKDQQVCADFIHEGVVKLSAVEMNRVLQECGYEHQRAISERHVAVLADLMKRDRWQPKSQIDFAWLNGRYILINGYHRAYAQVRTGKTINWSISVHPLKSEAELRSLYFAFDTNVRARGAGDILAATEFGATNGLSYFMAKALYSAVPYIASGFAVRPQDKNVLVEKQIDRRLSVAGEYAKAAARYSAAIENAPFTRRTKFRSGAVTAVGVITFRYQSETAWEFWTGVAGNDGLKRGDPRLALCNDMMTRNGKGNHMLAFAPAIIAWNAFFGERDLKLIKVLDTFSPVIDGTPFDGKVKAA